MSVLPVTVAAWGSVILQMLPQIMKVGQDLYALWCSMRGTKKQNDAVLRAMKLVNTYQDDIQRVLQNPEQKRQLLEGLTILMNRVKEHDGGGQARARGTNHVPLSQSSSSDGASGFTSSKSSKRSLNWLLCDVCTSEYNASDKRPTILICGHTFCRDCLRNVNQRGALICPTCRTPEQRPLASLPPNTSLMAALEEQEDKNDDSCCSGTNDECHGSSMSYEQEIECAIFLSQQQAHSKGGDYVAAKWKEVEEAEDENLALALQYSELYEASRLCAERYQAEDNNSAFNLPDKKKETSEVCCGDVSAHTPEGDEEASLRLALQLHQEEVVRIQSLYGGAGCSSSKEDDSCDWTKGYKKLFGSSVCNPANSEEGEEKTAMVEEKENNSEDRREEKEGEEEDVNCGCSSVEGETSVGKEEKEGGLTCHEDKDGKEDYESLVLMKEEELLIQEAIRLSSEEGEEKTAIIEEKEKNSEDRREEEEGEEEDVNCGCSSVEGETSVGKEEKEGGLTCHEDKDGKEDYESLVLMKEEELLIQEAIRLSLE